MARGELIRGLKDVEAIESVPLEQRLTAHNIYEAVSEGAALDPERPAFYFLPTGSAEEQPLVVRYRELISRIRQAANLFHDLGVGPTDVVTYLLPLLPQAFYVLFGAETTGIVCSINPMLEPAQILEILKAARTKVLVTLGPVPGSDIWPKINAIRKELPGLAATLQVMGPGDERDGVYPFDALLNKYAGNALASRRQIAPEDIASYFHTGGTTGTPKLAMHTHRGQVYQTWAVKNVVGWGQEEVVTAGLPMFHVGGAVAAMAHFSAGVTEVVLSPSGYRNPQVIKDHWKICQRYGVTRLFAVPTVFSALLNVPIGDCDLSKIKSATTAASPMPVEVLQAFEKKIGRKMVELYGMTEVTGATVTAPRDGERKPGSVGIRYPYVQLKTVVCDERGAYVRDCKVDEIGVVAMKGPCVFPGYVQEKHNAGIFFAEGWLNSGDLGRLDADGYLWLTGRAKDLIIRGGHNIDPALIEEVLHHHPAVALAAAVGTPDSYAGELPVAYVQLKPGQEATEAELQRYAREHITERAAAPVAVYVIPAIPQTAVGKIFKPELRWDAVRRTFTEKLQALGIEGLGIQVGVGPDASTGTLATVRLTAPAGMPTAELERQVSGVLGAYAVAHRVQWG